MPPFNFWEHFFNQQAGGGGNVPVQQNFNRGGGGQAQGFNPLLALLMSASNNAGNPYSPAFLTNAGGVGNQLQNAINQMFGVNQANQGASLFNNQLGAQLQSNYWNALSPVEQMRLRANADRDIAGIEGQSALDVINSPGYARQFSYQLPIAQTQADAMRDVERIRSERAQSIVDSIFGGGGIGGLFNNFGGIGGGGNYARPTGFASTDGNILAMMPQPQQNPLPTSAPTSQNQGGTSSSPAASSVPVNPVASAVAQAAPTQPSFGGVPGIGGMQGLVDYFQRAGRIAPSSNQYAMAQRRYG